MLKIQKDSRFSDIGQLPSKYYPYDLKDLHIRPFGVKELRLLSKAITYNNLDYMVSAVDQVIDHDAFSLTIGDFYYVLMWLRLQSFPKTPLVVTWPCEEKVLFHKETGDMLFNDVQRSMTEEELYNYRLEDCGTHNSESIYHTTLDIIHLEDDFDLAALDSRLDYPRARHLNDITQALADPELRMIVNAAQWIKIEVGEDTLENKIKLLEEQSDLELFDSASAANQVVVHGLAEATKLTCRKCRKQYNYAIQINPLSFFR